MNKKLFAAAAIVSAALAPGIVSAQAARSAGSQSYHLMQMSVNVSDMSAEEFQAKTDTIESCEDATKMARELKAKTTRNRQVRGSQLPEALRDELAELETGRATKVTQMDAKTFSVMVLCNRL